MSDGRPWFLGNDIDDECIDEEEKNRRVAELHAKLDTATSLHQPGAKEDGSKVPVRSLLLEYFPRALTEVAKVSDFGARKYTPHGWRSVPNGIERYADAGMRHAIAEITGGHLDRETGLHHAAHEAWNALARLELMLTEEENSG